MTGGKTIFRTSQIKSNEELFDQLIASNPVEPDARELKKRLEFKIWQQRRVFERQQDDTGASSPFQMTPELQKHLEQESKRELQIEGLVNKVASANNLFATDKELEIEYKAIAQRDGLSINQIRKFYRRSGSFDEENLKYQITKKKVLDFLVNLKSI